MLQDLLNRYSQARQSVVKGEEDAVKAHEELLETNEAFRVDTTNLKNSKTSNRRALLGELTANKEAMKTSLLELQQVNQYLTDLRPSARCTSTLAAFFWGLYDRRGPGRKSFVPSSEPPRPLAARSWRVLFEKETYMEASWGYHPRVV